MNAPAPLSIITAIPAGAPAPGMSAGKALAVALFNGAVALVAGIPLVIPDVDDNWKVIIAATGLVLSAVGSPVIVWLKTNYLTESVQVIVAGP